MGEFGGDFFHINFRLHHCLLGQWPNKTSNCNWLLLELSYCHFRDDSGDSFVKRPASKTTDTQVCCGCCSVMLDCVCDNPDFLDGFFFHARRVILSII